MDLQDLYRETILDHSRRPRGAGLREPFSAEVHQVNPICGDEVTLRVLLGDVRGDARELRDLSYEAVGCSISQAATSVMVDALTGRSTADARQAYDAFREIVTTSSGGSTLGPLEHLDPALADALGDAPAFAGVSLYPARVRCALLGWTALRQALVTAR